MDKCGFDFIELTGGSLSKLFKLKDESANKREAYFAEFALKTRSVVKNTVLYVTGGFRTAKVMVDCIKNSFTDGIGLGRPTTAEPGSQTCLWRYASHLQ
ncbi:unnamed protein product [Cylicostephanus goldi]|uniref:Uncharacterized protein n=1 Tax=Cylicostephanus goldi TaxID=71465 RepID=A0A3P7NL68_CYLGO|nr:unnamed protein product [Cylicostephanus goldi]